MDLRSSSYSHNLNVWTLAHFIGHTETRVNTQINSHACFSANFLALFVWQGGLPVNQACANIHPETTDLSVLGVNYFMVRIFLPQKYWRILALLHVFGIKSGAIVPPKKGLELLVTVQQIFALWLHSWQ